MMINALECAPTICIDCHTKLGKPVYEHYAQLRSSVWLINCSCGCVYIWGWDDKHLNGGIWKRRHLAPLFDDRARLELTPEQIARSERRATFNRKVNEAAQERLRERIKTGRR